MNAHVATPTVSAFAWVPDFAKGQVRDLRVRWALEEAGLPYRTDLLSPGQANADYRRHQPFGQVPAFQDGEVDMFESGAIVLHIAERAPALMPTDPAGRARTISWMFAALNTMEPPIQTLGELDFFHADQDWAKARRPAMVAWVEKRAAELAQRLGDNPYLDSDRFTAGDLLMTTVLRIIDRTDLIRSQPRLNAYLERCTGRPAFQKALAAQMADFMGSPPPGWG
ncbi:glutathione S-transferase family protein [uncultured Caulobacter sp.]|uniref:glutathione S-transferase family protein n=1 Tax=uncultured Caulobacter sp. TaxID=158749 RepID=UPI00262BA960|nr:glutathione S-transferase family protein [uncultured Caulobacter sp.]